MGTCRVLEWRYCGGDWASGSQLTAGRWSVFKVVSALSDVGVASDEYVALENAVQKVWGVDV